MTNIRAILHPSSLILGCVLAFGAGAQQYPTKPIRMIIGFTPGSEIDVVGRMIAQEVSDSWGQRVVIDNRTGAGGTVGGAIAATAPADGYTLLFNSVSHAASQALYPKLTYDTLRDFTGVSQATSAPNVLLIAPSQGVKTTRALIAGTRGTVAEGGGGAPIEASCLIGFCEP